MHVLCIEASARAARSLSRQLCGHFVAQLTTNHPSITVTRRDVGLDPPPFVSEAFIAAAFTPEAERTSEQRAVLAVSNELIAEVHAADLIIIASPMYNYGMPAALKAWFDQVIRIGQTFSFDLARGDFPLEPIQSGKTMVVLATHGEFGFGPGGVRARWNHLVPHIVTAARYLGVEQHHAVSIEYQEFGGQRHDESITVAFQKADKLAELLATARECK
jgi:FMN-dependent NADH-azoreductase